MEASGILERIAACLPCAACGSRSWQLWPGEFDDDAQPILTAPTPALAECLIPPSVSHIYADRERSPSGVDAPWDTGALSPSGQQKGLSPRGDVPDRPSAQRGGIELKEAAANPLLGQGHLESGGRFVKAKLTSAAAEGTAVHASSASSGDSFSFPGSKAGADEDPGEAATNKNRPGRTPGQTPVPDPSPFGSPAVVL